MSTQQNPTLIPGFEDIMRHIRQQEDQIKKLEDTIKNCGENYTKLYQHHVDLQEENKKLKEEIDDKVHWQQTMVSYIDDGDGWCHFDRWFGENIDEDDKKQEWVKYWMEQSR